MLRLPASVVMTMHVLLPAVAMVCVTVLAAMGRISGSDALVVIVAVAGIGGTGSAGVTALRPAETIQAGAGTSPVDPAGRV